MVDPGYDFFATRQPSQTPEPVPAVGAPQSQLLQPTPPTQPSQPSQPMPTAQSTAVNRFGMPIDLPVAPTGPYAAPGIGAVPTATPGMVSTWAGPPVPTRARPTARAAAVWDRPPRNVVAVAVLAIVLGVLAAIPTVAALSTYLDLKGQLDSLGAGADLGGQILGVMLVAIVVMGLVAAFLLTGGIATVAGQRWGAWLLVVAFALYLLGQLQALVNGGFGLVNVIGVLIGVVLVLSLVSGEGRRWLLAT
jgi:hypothetical protein